MIGVAVCSYVLCALQPIMPVPVLPLRLYHCYLSDATALLPQAAHRSWNAVCPGLSAASDGRRCRLQLYAGTAGNDVLVVLVMFVLFSTSVFLLQVAVAAQVVCQCTATIGNCIYPLPVFYLLAVFKLATQSYICRKYTSHYSYRSGTQMHNSRSHTVHQTN